MGYELKRLVFVVLISSCMFSCTKENMCDCFKGTGDDIMETRTLSDFDVLEVHKNVIVKLVQDTINYVVVEGGDNLISLVKTDVDNGALNITNNNTCNWVRSFKKEISATLHFKNIKEISHYGSKDITSENTIITKSLNVQNFNSADIHLTVQTDECFARLMGASGDIYITGQTNYSYVFGGSFGFAYEQDLVHNTCFVDHRGNGDIYVSTGALLQANLSYVGNIYYTGNGKVESKITGSGKLIRY